MPRWVSTLLLVVLIGAIGFADWATGPEVGLSLFYLLPIALAGWRLGWAPAVVLALEAAVLWLAAELGGRPEARMVVSLWNGLTRLSIYLAIGILTARVRQDRRELESLNEQLRRALQREVNLARTDAITGMPNSRFLLEYLQAESTRRKSERLPVALIYIDLDNFKQVNDIFGHGSGDVLLQRVAAVLRGVQRAGDMAARVGGDEFAILLDAASDRQRMQEVAASLQRGISALGKDYPNSHFGVSVGTAFFESAPDDPDQLLRSADAAMYDVKVANKLRAMS